MPMFITKMAMLAKIEATSGTDPVPTGALNAILARNWSLNPLELTTEDRQVAEPWLGHTAAVIAASWQTMSFDVELAGSGAAGTAPAYGPLLMACKHSQTISAGVSTTYAPVSGADDSVTIYVYIDGRLHKMSYGRGSVALVLDSRKIPVFRFSFTGLYAPVTDAALPTPVYTGFIKPLAVNKANTTLTLHGISVFCDQFTMDVKNQIVYRNQVGNEAVYIPQRLPEGSIVFEKQSIATKDWYSTILAGTTGALAIQHGTVAGNIVSIAAGAVQALGLKLSTQQGIQMLNLGLRFLPSSGNDEYSIVVK